MSAGEWVSRSRVKWRGARMRRDRGGSGVLVAGNRGWVRSEKEVRLLSVASSRFTRRSRGNRGEGVAGGGEGLA